MSCRVPLAALAAASIVLGGCAAKRSPVAPAPIAPVVKAPVVAPVPPDGAAPNLIIPVRLADGSYATPNRQLTAAGAVWHLRAAFNVAALNCPDSTLVPAYNGWLKLHRAELAAAHRTLAAETSSAAFDTAMTRLYNYFAQPPVMARFCATAAPLLQQSAALSPGALSAFASDALASIDAPFNEFYARYDAYRAARAVWQSDALATTRLSAAPRLGYDRSVLIGGTMVTGGKTTLAAR